MVHHCTMWYYCGCGSEGNGMEGLCIAWDMAGLVGGQIDRYMDGHS